MKKRSWMIRLRLFASLSQPRPDSFPEIKVHMVLDSAKDRACGKQFSHYVLTVVFCIVLSGSIP